MFKQNLFVPGKHSYIRGTKRPKVDCIICSILNKDSRVTSLLVWEDELAGISANLYPYNAGHIFIFPRRHISDIRSLSQEEMLRIFQLTKTALDILENYYEPVGFNIGINMGEASGASIEHLHQHIVPRYHKELGFMDIIGGSKIIVEDPVETMNKLKNAFQKLKI